ncbi:MAG: host attachment protein [Bdellovibrionia bacterium]
MNTWILCPNLWGARLFVTDNFDEVPRFLRELPRPKVRLRHEDFDTDDDIPELTVDPKDHDAEVKVAEQYSEQLSHFLEHACEQNQFDRLVLCAEAQLLGILKNKLGSKCRARVIGTIQEDLYEVNETDLADYVKGFKNKAA